MATSWRPLTRRRRSRHRGFRAGRDARSGRGSSVKQPRRARFRCASGKLAAEESAVLPIGFGMVVPHSSRPNPMRRRVRMRASPGPSLPSAGRNPMPVSGPRPARLPSRSATASLRTSLTANASSVKWPSSRSSTTGRSSACKKRGASHLVCPSWLLCPLGFCALLAVVPSWLSRPLGAPAVEGPHPLAGGTRRLERSLSCGRGTESKSGVRTAVRACREVRLHDFFIPEPYESFDELSASLTCKRVFSRPAKTPRAAEVQLVYLCRWQGQFSVHERVRREKKDVHG